MPKTKLHVWISMLLCLVAVAAEAVNAGSIALPF